MLKKDLEIQLNAANKLIADQRESIEAAARANIAVNKQLQDDQSEVRRLRKVLDRAITAVDSRISTISYVPPLIIVPAGCSPAPQEIIEEPQKSENEKFLMFLAGQVLYDQYKPANKTNSGGQSGW